MKTFPVASFNQDHRSMMAPRITLSSSAVLSDNVTLYKYDVRLCKPNISYIQPKAMHALEHIAAVEIRSHLDDVWDLSPMGCMTGFYLSIINEPDIDKISAAFKECLHTASIATEVPAANEIQCGNYKFIDIVEMKMVAKEILSRWS